MSAHKARERAALATTTAFTNAVSGQHMPLPEATATLEITVIALVTWMAEFMPPDLREDYSRNLIDLIAESAKKRVATALLMRGATIQ
jgi:hypothetical protein